MAKDEVTFEAVLTEWRSLGSRESVGVGAWESALVAMRVEMLDLRSRGSWRSGGLTLLNQLGLHHDEVLLCRGLGWLLSPDGWHGLGDSFLRGLVGWLGLPTDSLDQATVALEETRGDTRADVIVRYPGACVLIEAKVLAGEQPGQADRLASGWAGDNPRLVFLSPQGREPQTAVATAGHWSCLSWTDLARVGEDLANRDDLAVAPGARELIDTWKHYGG